MLFRSGAAVVQDAPTESFIYLDPPYWEQRPDTYATSFGEADHRHLAEALGNTLSAWLLSYDDSPFVRGLYHLENELSNLPGVDVKHLGLLGEPGGQFLARPFEAPRSMNTRAKGKTAPELRICPSSHRYILGADGEEKRGFTEKGFTEMLTKVIAAAGGDQHMTEPPAALT